MKSIFLLAGLVAGNHLLTGCAGASDKESSKELGSDLADKPAEVQADARTVTQCHGTEPFWSLELSNNKMTFNVNDDASVIDDKPEARSAEGLESSYVAFYPGKKLSAIVKREQCRGVGEDPPLLFSVSVVKEGSLFVGCCSAPSAAKAR